MSLADLRTHARVVSTEHELRIWLPARWPFLAVSALVLAASLTTEAVLVAYARQQNSSGAWAIVTIVTLWLLAVVLMIRRRLRAIDQHPTLRLTQDTLHVEARAVPLAAVRDVKLVERATYALVEIHTDDAVLPVTLRSAAQGQPLAAVLSSHAAAART